MPKTSAVPIANTHVNEAPTPTNDLHPLLSVDFVVSVCFAEVDDVVVVVVVVVSVLFVVVVSTGFVVSFTFAGISSRLTTVPQTVHFLTFSPVEVYVASFTVSHSPAV